MPAPQLQILIPVHNEAESIEATVREIYDTLHEKVGIEFIVCEDGSSDGTPEILERLAGEVPMQLDTSRGRKGYSRAVLDGFAKVSAPYLLCLDSDGQCDPRDFDKLWQRRDQYDIVIGWRVHRADVWVRRAMSRAFGFAYRIFFSPPVHDPSCPYVLARKDVVEALRDELGTMRQGFWWEFVARAWGRGFRIGEVPVAHRLRSAGNTQVYKPKALPKIASSHLLGLFTVWKQTRRTHPAKP